MSVKQYNHHCIVCGTGYHFCNDCSKISSFVPWRKVACSTECYQAHLAYIEYRDITHDAKQFAKMIDGCGLDVSKAHEALKEAYHQGTKDWNAEAVVKAGEMAESEKASKSNGTEEQVFKTTKARRK